MPHKFNPEGIERLLRPDRLGAVNPEEFLRSEGLRQGMTFADVGCGPGFFSMPASRIVGKNGVVYAIDTQDEMLRELKRGADAENIKAVKSVENSIPIEDGVSDFVLLAYVLHEAESKDVFLKEVRRILKPGATLLLLDWEKRGTHAKHGSEENGPPFEERLSREETLGYLKEAGFSTEAVSSFGESHYKISAKRAGKG